MTGSGDAPPLPGGGGALPVQPFSQLHLPMPRGSPVVRDTLAARGPGGTPSATGQEQLALRSALLRERVLLLLAG